MSQESEALIQRQCDVDTGLQRLLRKYQNGKKKRVYTTLVIEYLFHAQRWDTLVSEIWNLCC